MCRAAEVSYIYECKLEGIHPTMSSHCVTSKHPYLGVVYVHECAGLSPRPRRSCSAVRWRRCPQYTSRLLRAPPRYPGLNNTTAAAKSRPFICKPSRIGILFDYFLTLIRAKRVSSSHLSSHYRGPINKKNLRVRLNLFKSIDCA